MLLPLIAASAQYAEGSGKLTKEIEKLKRSADRLGRVNALPRGRDWTWFVRKESWIHLKTAFKLWFRLTILRRKE